MNDKCALQDPERIKARVRGENGPDRQKLPLFYKLGTVDPTVVRTIHEEIMFLVNGLPKDYNDIQNSDRYEIAQACKLKTYFPTEYKQYLLQVTGNSSIDVPDEWEYDTYTKEGLKFRSFITPYVNPHFRARIAILPPGAELDWHIDTNTSYACRVQIMISGNQIFEIKKKSDIEQRIMLPGHVWFCNTGYRHRVRVIGDESRVSILVGCHFDAIKQIMS